MDSQFILIVDDEPGVAMLCKRLLGREGYSTESFTEPQLAVKFLSQRAIDLLLVDIRMPEVDGFEVIEHTQRLQPDAAILIMTGHGTVETAIKALRKGVDGLILKPFGQGNDLIVAVRQAFVDNQQKRDAGRTKALQPLFSVTESLLSETRRDKLLGLITAAICNHLHCSASAFFQIKNETNSYQMLASQGDVISDEIQERLIDLIPQVDHSVAPVVVNANGPDGSKFNFLFSGGKIGSVMVTPMLRPGLGSALLAARLAGDPPFRGADQELFQILARQAVVALENASLYEEQVEYVRKMEESQKALLQAEKMATAGRLTASIAHEVNNPLQAVQNCLHLAGRKDITVDQQQEYIQMAQTELERLMMTVQRMLDYYRPGGSAFDRVSVGEALQYVIDLMSKQLTENGIQIMVSIPVDLPGVLAVRSQLQQVFINLILNAADAMPSGGRLHITGHTMKDGVEILFKDSGSGISPEMRASIFEPFFSTKEGGSGLGLTVSSNIVTAHGGTLELVPDQKTGTCFKLFLPVGGKP